jgi:sugar (pentulose or hexulose) kinase
MSTHDQPYLLSIDNGTQSVRAIVFDREGQLIDKVKIDIEAYRSPQPGWAEQDADYYWQTIVDACQALWRQARVKPEEIAALTVTTQRGTVVNLDSNGRPLRPAIVWLDQREAPEAVHLGALEWPLRLLGLKSSIAYFASQAEANWIAQCQPEVWAKTHKYLLLSGYHNFRLTGKYVDSVASQDGYIPFDYKQQQWSGASSWHWRALPLTPDMLPALKPAGSELGGLSDEAAAQLGLPVGLKVIASGSDKACESLGAGSVDASVGCMSYGTTATYNGNFERHIEPAFMLPAYPSAVPGRYNSEAIIYRGFWMLSWFRDQMGQLEQQQAQQQGVAVETLFDKFLRDTEAGAMGLTLQPYWSPGIREPGPGAKGAIIGFGDVHGKAHIYRAIIEGLCFALREGKERIEKRGRNRIETLRISGGGSQSDDIMQISADIFGMPVERPSTYETSALGAAINMAVGLGWYPDYAAAVANMTGVGKTFYPNEENAAYYDQMYHEVYRRMFGKLSGLYQGIRKLTGYPRYY